MEYEIEIYQDRKGKMPFLTWLESLPTTEQRRIRARLVRVESGNLGDFKALGNGVLELRFTFGSGYRTYFGFRNKTLILLISGGDKSTQVRDIKKAKELWNSLNYENLS